MTFAESRGSTVPVELPNGAIVQAIAPFLCTIAPGIGLQRSYPDRSLRQFQN